MILPTYITNVMTDTSHITLKNVYWLGFALLFTYILIFYILDNFFPGFDKLTYDVCLFKCYNSKCKTFINKTKGDNYYLSKYSISQAFSKVCVFTPYELSHIIYHIFIGYYFNIYYSLAIGFTFEFIEWRLYNCENVMDIIYNTIGAMIGIFLRYRMR